MIAYQSNVSSYILCSLIRIALNRHLNLDRYSSFVKLALYFCSPFVCCSITKVELVLAQFRQVFIQSLLRLLHKVANWLER